MTEEIDKETRELGLDRQSKKKEKNRGKKKIRRNT